MTNYFKYSKIIHIIALFCFFLPFFYDGCSGMPSKTAEEEVEKSKTDSLKAEDAVPQSMVVESTADSTHVQSTTTSAEEPKTVSAKIVKKLPFLRMLLVPKPDTYSGIAIIINSGFMIEIFGIFVAFLLLAMGLVFKFMEPNARKVTLLTSILGLVFFAIAKPMSFDSKTLWGYWVCLSVIVLLIVFDCYVFMINRRK